MAFLVKRSRQSATSASQQGNALLEQVIQVTRPSLALPQSTTEQLFRVRGGRVKVKMLLGTVATTAIQGTDPVMKVSSKALDAASAAVGTAVDIASTVDTSSLEIGGTVFVEGDGTALVKANAGCVFIGSQGGEWIAPQGEIYLTTGASKTGQMKWDIWYEPIDPGAYVDAIGVATAAI